MLRGIFAMSSLHLSRTVGVEKERETYQTMAAVQMNTGLVHYRSAMEEVSADNAEALFAYATTTSVFIVLTTADECKSLLKSLQSEGGRPNQRRAAVSGLAHAIIGIMRNLRGILIILVPCWHLIANGILQPIVKREWWPHRYPISPQAIEEDRKLAELENLWAHPDRRYEYWFDTLRSSLKRLRECFGLVSQLTVAGDDRRPGGRLIDWTSVVTWPISNSLDFIDLIEQRQPEAWIILAHYAILPARVENVWWIEGLASNILSTAALVLKEEMWTWLEWPATVVGVDLDSLRPHADGPAG